MIHIQGNTNARINEMAADTAPSFKAVKKEEVYILNHINKNGNAHIIKARAVIASRSAS